MLLRHYILAQDATRRSTFLLPLITKSVTVFDMITSFACRETELVFMGRFSRRLPSDITRVAERKLRLVHMEKSLNDLRIPPANHLEALKDDRAGQHMYSY